MTYPVINSPVAITHRVRQLDRTCTSIAKPESMKARRTAIGGTWAFKVEAVRYKNINLRKIVKHFWELNIVNKNKEILGVLTSLYYRLFDEQYKAVFRMVLYVKGLLAVILKACRDHNRKTDVQFFQEQTATYPLKSNLLAF